MMRGIYSGLVASVLCLSVFAAEKDYHGQDLKEKDFAGASLNGADFSDATLRNTVFTKASLKKAKFKDANVEGTYFMEADLTEADMRGTTGSANYRYATLAKTNFEGVTFIPWDGCKCRGANFKNTKMSGYLANGDFTEVDLRGASLRGCKLGPASGFKWKNAIYDDDTAFPEGFDPKAVGMVMKAADEKPTKEDAKDAPAVAKAGKDYHDQDLSGKDFNNSALNGANFSDAKLKSATFNYASLKRANFKGANLENAVFGDADLTGADMRDTVGNPNYRGAILSKTNFEGVTFIPWDRCTCKEANFKNTKMSGYIASGDFSGADFRGASLRGVKFGTPDGLKWKGAIYDDDTAFPEGFDPKAVGMKMAAEEKK